MRKGMLLLVGLVALTAVPLRAAPATKSPVANPLRPNATKPKVSKELRAYQRQVSDVVGRAWYRAIQAYAAETIESGTVKIRFYLRPSGAVEGIQVISAKGKNPHLIWTSEEALRAAKIPPMPPKVRADLPQPRDSMEVDFTFTSK